VTEGPDGPTPEPALTNQANGIVRSWPGRKQTTDVIGASCGSPFIEANSISLLQAAAE
jgi:hypothetical protein